MEPEVTEPVALDDESYMARSKRIDLLGFEVYPNPDLDILYATKTGQTNDILNYCIFDIQGIVRMKGRITGSEMHTISLRELELGLYYIQITANYPAFQKTH